MKLRLFSLLLMTFLFAFDGMATQPIALSNDATVTTFELSKHDNNVNAFGKVKNWYKKKITSTKLWIAKKLMAIDFDFEDPNSVLKMALLGLLGGIIFFILGWAVTPLYYVGYLLWTVGAALFIYWLILKLTE